MKLTDIHTELKADFTIKRDQLDEELHRIPDLMNKWFPILSEERLRLKRLEREHKALIWGKTEYYLGHGSPEMYKQEPLDRVILKSDVGMWLDADAKIAESQSKIDIQQEKVHHIERAIKHLDSRGFNINSAVNFLKFTKGQDF